MQSYEITQITMCPNNARREELSTALSNETRIRLAFDALASRIDVDDTMAVAFIPSEGLYDRLIRSCMQRATHLIKGGYPIEIDDRFSAVRVIFKFRRFGNLRIACLVNIEGRTEIEAAVIRADTEFYLKALIHEHNGRPAARPVMD